jgi:2-hydroxy-6-oxo-6-(2'-aminophenyl)hexa-2,4-dienoate hydrolase
MGPILILSTGSLDGAGTLYFRGSTEKWYVMVDLIDEKHVVAGGIETHYFDGGTGDPLVLVHGGGPGIDAWGNWQYVMPMFAARGYRVIAPDVVGFGQTQAPSPDQFEYRGSRLVKHLVDFIKQVELSSPTVVGQSLGASLALGLAIEHPDLIDRLVLLGPSGRAIAERDQQEVSRGLDREEMLSFAKSMSVQGNVDFEELVDRRMQMWQRGGVEAAHHAIWSDLLDGGLAFDDSEIAKIGHDVLLIQGKQDTAIDLDYAWKYTKLIENAALRVISGAGHWEMIDRAKEVVVESDRFFTYTGTN